ncbi:hypothetical protein SNE40_021276 [Patella caerulea]|uniref:Uncharacterized protein n=1 Tax=Patella caerulea TaxID=87958 RepID=A0AAN8G3M7_PATCE
MLCLRDQFSHEPIKVSNQQLIHDQSLLRSINHPYSSKSKAHGKGTLPLAELKVGDLVYLYSDYSKKAARDRYIVVSITKNWCNIQKFTSTQLPSKVYTVKVSECIKVPEHQFSQSPHDVIYPDDDNDSSFNEFQNIPPEIFIPPEPTDIPLITPPNDTTNNIPNSGTPVVQADDILRRSTLHKNLPEHLKDFVVEL